MVAKESVRARMEDREAGISYTEFSYMLLQAFDFMVLARDQNCELQIGGSDQWGNITAGIDLCRKKLGKTVFGLTLPLITNADRDEIRENRGRRNLARPETHERLQILPVLDQRGRPRCHPLSENTSRASTKNRLQILSKVITQTRALVRHTRNLH